MGRVFLAGDAAHLLGALGTQGLDEGLRDADNLAWKLALAWHHGPHEALLDSYQAERRAVVAARLRAADQSLPMLRGAAACVRTFPVPRAATTPCSRTAIWGAARWARRPRTPHSPLAPDTPLGRPPSARRPGAPVADVRVTAEDGSFVRLRDRLGRRALLVVLIAPGTGVWERSTG